MTCIDLKNLILDFLSLYYIEAIDGRNDDIIIAIPKVIEKFYFKINGSK